MSVNKHDLKHLYGIAETLPVVVDKNFDGAAVKKIVSGDQLVKSGVTKVGVYGKVDVDASKLYAYDIKQPVAVNHARRLKKAFKRGGVDAVKSYLDKVKTA